MARGHERRGGAGRADPCPRRQRPRQRRRSRPGDTQAAGPPPRSGLRCTGGGPRPTPAAPSPAAPSAPGKAGRPGLAEPVMPAVSCHEAARPGEPSPPSRCGGRRPAVRLRGPDPDPAWALVAACAVCGREASGFGYVHELAARTATRATASARSAASRPARRSPGGQRHDRQDRPGAAGDQGRPALPSPRS